jgi:hypothetical protein
MEQREFLSVIAASPMDHPSEQRIVVIRVTDILYAFRGSAVSQHLIDADWRRQYRFNDNRVYLRTKRGVFLTHFRSLQKLSERLDPQAFAQVHQNILVNLKASVVLAVELHARIRAVYIALSDNSVESLRISRRHLASLRAKLGLSLRSVSDEAETGENDSEPFDEPGDR